MEQELADKKNLQTVYFEGNPLQRLNAITYRNKVRLALPQIVQIDASKCIVPLFLMSSHTYMLQRMCGLEVEI